MSSTWRSATASCSSCSGRRAAARRRRCAASPGLERADLGRRSVIGDEARQRPAPVAAGHRDGVPVLRAVSASQRARQPGVSRCARPGVPETEVTERVERGGTDAAARAAARPQAEASSPAASSSAWRSARAMVRHPKAFLMDEPLTNLDAELRADMRAELKHVQQRLARRWSTSPTTRPRRWRSATGSRSSTRAGSSRSARRWRSTTGRRRCSPPAFIGSPPMNLVDAEITNGHLTAAGGLALTAPDGLRRGERVVAGVRPEALRRVRVRRR